MLATVILQTAVRLGEHERPGNFTSGPVSILLTEFASSRQLDTVPPHIIPLNIKNGGNMALAKGIFLRIGDNLSGVKSYTGKIDDKWVLMEWDYKTKILSYTFDDSVSAGKHTFELTVTDQVNNVSTFKADFYR